MKNTASMGIWVYPWDLEALGVERVVDYCAQHRISFLGVAAVYHSGQILSMAKSPHWVHQGEGPLVDWTSSISTKSREFLQALRSSLQTIGTELHGWVVLNHDKRGWEPILSASHESLPHTACPVANQSRVERVLQQLANNTWFDTLQLELPDWIGAVHGAHHDIVGIHLTPLLRLLLSLCFCQHCQQQWGSTSSWDRVRQQVLADMTYYMDAEPAPADGMAQLATYILENPEVADLLRARSRWLASFIEKQQHTVTVPLIPIVTPFQFHGELSWMTGLVPEAERFSRVILLAYGPPNVISQDVTWLGHRGWGRERITMGHTLVASATPDLATAQARLRRALDAGIKSHIFYNWGLLNAPRRKWLDDLMAMVERDG